MAVAKRDPADALQAHSAPDGSQGGGWTRAARTAGKAPKRGRSGCRCGRCARCADNARWERIFAEKFADPDYYSILNMCCSSPLESL